ncbi:MAG: sulfite exporter TauE/SafE family protein [Rhodospirillales bacterium]
MPAVLIAGVSKVGFGGAFGGLAVPVMSLVISPVQAAGILLPILCVMDLFGLRAYEGRWDRANMRIILPGALVGIVLGTLCFDMMNDAAIRLIVGTIAVGFALSNWLDLVPNRGRAGVSVGKGLFWSTLSGFTSFVGHSGAPPILVYLMPQRLDKSVFVATTVVFFCVVNYVKIVPYGFLGQLSATNLETSMLLLPAAPAGVWLGQWAHGKVKEMLFYRLSYLLLFAAGARLMYDGALKLLA